MIYFTSDTHFFHSNIINLADRPFENCNEMNYCLIRNWNSYVSDNDEIYILGDFAYKGDATKVNEILRKLKGKKYLIKGNHDKYLNQEEFEKNAFEWIKDYYVLNYKKEKFVLFHYPILEWDGYFKGVAHLYGHVHNCNKDKQQTDRLKTILGDKAYNVGVDTNNYFPISIENIIKKLNL